MTGIFSSSVFHICIEILIIILCVSLLLCFYRLYKGRNPPNRAVAFDLIAIHAVAVIALFSMRSEAPVLLDAALITAVLGFLGTMVLARFLERSDSEDWRDPN